jgi:hypothetical protein
MLLGSITTVLALASGWLWWKLGRAEDDNAELLAEVARLRARLRSSRR